MNIALCHFRVGETDGVSLEMDKWKLILERLGHNVFFLAGSQGTSQAYIIEELHYAHPINDKIVENAYVELKDYTESQLMKEINDLASKIEKKLIGFIRDNNIDIVVPNNIWSLGWGLSAGIGFSNAIMLTRTMCIVHHHDFYWEREKYSNPTCSGIKDLLNRYFPPKAPFIKHCVINNIAKEEIKKRKDIDAAVVPNVFDFSADPWIKDEYNEDFRRSIGIDKNDILLLQATRITERKAIEVAVDVASGLNNNLKNSTLTLYDGRKFTSRNKVVLVLAGLTESENEYTEKLIKKAKNNGLELVFCNEVIKHSRCTINNTKQYSLWDVYVHADFITYPSILEGWGNQFLEGVFAKKPILVFEYPVYKSDIRRHNFNVVSLGDTYSYTKEQLVQIDQNIIVKAAKEMEFLLVDNKLRTDNSSKNYEIASREFSYDSLQRILEHLF
ncbi:MAG: glycosyltransferase family 4 protein [Spirochaetaceae bacterium]